MAHNVVVRHAPNEHFCQEIELLKSGKQLLKSSSVICHNHVLDKDIILRVGGRSGRHPILIPHIHVIAQSVARHYHSVGHVGIEWSLSKIRDRYWITKARKVMK